MLLAISTITDRGSDNFSPVTKKRQYHILSKYKTFFRPIVASTLFLHILHQRPKITPTACLVLRFIQVAEPLDIVKDNFY